jgi:hypothetical protein
MQPYAIIVNNVVVNVCVWDGVTPFSPGGVLMALSTLPPGIDIGWTLVNNVWTPPGQ